MWVCKYCESVNSDEDYICVVCDQYKDSKYNEKMYCIHCGTIYRVNEVDKFCIHCGKSLLNRNK